MSETKKGICLECGIELSNPAVDFSDRYRNIKTEENYMSLLKSGMFWEFHPELTGNWYLDESVINGT